MSLPCQRLLALVTWRLSKTSVEAADFLTRSRGWAAAEGEEAVEEQEVLEEQAELVAGTDCPAGRDSFDTWSGPD
jgi:hypothetical protein